MKYRIWWGVAVCACVVLSMELRAQLPSVVQRGMAAGGRGGTAPAADTSASKKPKMLPKDYRILALPEQTFFSQRLDTANYAPDTTLHLFWQYAPNFTQNTQFNNLGVIGSPQQPLAFAPAQPNVLQLGSRFEHLTTLNPENLPYYYTNIPLTDAYIVYGSKKQQEQTLRLLHTQNIGKKINVGFVFNKLGTKSYLENQEVQNTQAAIFFKYQNEAQSYFFTANYTYNRFQNQENGGLKQDISQLLLTPENWGGLRLSGAASTDRNRSLYFANYKKLQSGYWCYQKTTATFGFQQFKADASQSFFTLRFYDPRFTNDSTHYTETKNTFGVKKGIFDAQITHNYLYYNQFVRYDATAHSTPNRTHAQNLSLRLETDLTDYIKLRLPFKLRATAQYVLLGYGAKTYTGNLNVRFRGKLQPGLNFYMATQPPKLLENINFTNQIQWENNFLPTRTATVSAYLGGERLQVFGQFTGLKNQIFYNQIALPVQNPDNFSIAQLGIKHDFALFNGWLHLSGNNIIQKVAGSSSLRLPFFSSSNSLYVGKKLKKGYTFYVGTDVRYNTNYFANAYQPNTGVFFLQDTYKLQNYVVTDVFAALSVSAVRIFAKLEHSDQYAFGSTYYTTVLYPAPIFGVKIGLHWRFYN